MSVTQTPLVPTPPVAPRPQEPGLTALIFSIMGFFQITALLGIVLGFMARSKAKKLGLPKTRANIAIGVGVAWLVPTVLIASTSMWWVASGNQERAEQARVAVSTETVSTAAKASTSDIVGGAWTVCKDNVVGQLSAPDSASFPLYSSSDIQTSVQGTVVGIVAWVDAENSLGGTVRTPFSCSANYDAATDSYAVSSDLGSTTMPKASTLTADAADKAIKALEKRGFSCTPRQGKFDLVQCRKGTVADPTYGEQPKELVNLELRRSDGVSLEGYATPNTVKVLKKYGAKAWGGTTYGARQFDNAE